MADAHERNVEKEIMKGLAPWVRRGGPDLAQAQFVLNFGANPLGRVRHVLGDARLWAEAAGRGCRWVTIDPRLSETANAGSEWIPVRPGTDGALAAALALEILKNGWAKPGCLSDMVSGERQQLDAYLKEWPSERAAGICGVRSRKILDLARTFAKSDRPVALFGNGVIARQNGERDARLILLLNVLTGRVDRPGGYRLGGCTPWVQPEPAIDLPEGIVSHGTLFWSLGQGHKKIGALMTCEADPAVSDPDCEGTVRVLQSRERVPVHVAVSSLWTKTARQADLVIPAASWLAGWGLHRGGLPGDGRSWIGLQQAVPMSGTGFPAPEEILLASVRAMGSGARQAFPFESVASYYRSVLERSFPISASPASFDELRRKGFAEIPGRESDRVSGFSWKGFAGSAGNREKTHKTGKTLLLFGSPMQEAASPYSPWVEEIDHRRPLWMHPAAAGEIGCADGDEVIVKGPAGEIRTRVRLTQGLHPEAVAMKGAGVESLERAGEGVAPWWEKEAYGENARKIVPWPADPLREAPGWDGTKVEVVRVRS